MYIKKLKIIIALFVFGIGYSQDASVNLYPANTNQEVVFGGDGKLTINAWANGNLSLIAKRLFVDMKMTTLRVPIFANQTIDSPIYDDVITVIKSVKQANPNVKLMASLTNGDGYGTDFHGASKFFPQWVGCCSYNVYSLNLTSYASYLDSFMQLMDDNNIYIDYLGPFNEDPADNSDFSKVFNQMDNLGSTKKIGLERWGLQTSVNDIDDVETVLDIAGSHFYDDENISDWDGTWTELVDKSSIPIWYTEATRYTTTDGIDKLIAGMNNIFPAINGGAESVLFYQALRRFIWANGSISGNIKYTGFKNIVNESNGKKVIDASIDGDNMRITAFSDEEAISLHITNDDNNTKTTEINILGNYSAAGTITRTIWTSNSTEVSNAYSLNQVKSWNVTVPANSYVHLKIPILSTTSVASDVFIEAEDFNAMSGIQTEDSTESGDNVGYINNGDWLRFDNVNLSGITNMDARVATRTAGGTIEVRTGSVSGTLIGSIDVSNTGGYQNWTTLNTNISNASGTQDVYLVFTGGNGYLYNVNWVEFNTSSRSNKDIDEVISATSEVKLYPNPVESTTIIENAVNTVITVYAMDSSVVFSQAISNESEVIDFSGLATGIYFAEVKGKGVLEVIKLVKN